MIDVLIPYAKEILTISSTALGLTQSVFKTGQHHEVRKASITVEDADIRFWTTGDDPVGGSAGHLATSGSTINLTLPNSVINFKAIRAGAVDAVLQVTYEKDY